MFRVTAESLQRVYGAELAAPPYIDITTFRKLRRQLELRVPPVIVTDQVCNQWLLKYRTPEGAVRITSVKQLEDEHGGVVRHVVLSEVTTPYRLCKALKALPTPLLISDAVAKGWLEQYGGHVELRLVNSAGHLELWYGDLIRAQASGKACGPLRDWLRGVGVSALQTTCRTWLDRDWSTAGRLLTPARVGMPAYRRDVGRVALPSSRDDPGQYPCAPRGMEASRGSMDMPPAASPGYTFSDASVFGGRGSSDRAPCRRRSRSRGDGVRAGCHSTAEGRGG